MIKEKDGGVRISHPFFSQTYRTGIGKWAARFAWCAFLAWMVVPWSGVAREVVTLRSNWKFARGHQEHAYQVKFDDSKWETVTVPHDWAIAGPFDPAGDGNTGKLPWKGEGWYRLPLQLPEELKGKVIYLLFDGVMASPEVYVNGKPAGKWDYGYNSFYLDITRLVKPGAANLLAVHADTRGHDSRWYPGAGIFRKVQLIAVEPVHVAVWGTQVTTPVAEVDQAEVVITSSVLNSTGKAAPDVSVEFILCNPSGKVVARRQEVGEVPGGQSQEFKATLTFDAPDRWDVGHGALYTAHTLVKTDGRTVDSTVTRFGVRSIRFTADDGFHLNGRRVQLKGVNLHHDLGPLGAAFNYRAQQRQLELLVSMGCNAIRTSHNMPAPELLDLCDEMGILVFDEGFDKYDAKADIGEKTDFEEFAARNVRNFITRDRNHPSVFIWSIGNEMGDVQWDKNNGFARMKTMIGYYRKYDPTRPVTMVCDSRNSAEKRHFDFYDVHAWNYGRRYDLARRLEPNKSVIISESASTVSTRGFYELPLPAKKTDFTSSMQVSSYDLNAPDWAEISDDDFMWQQDEPYVAGEFVWTGFDYLGEPTPYTNEWAEKNGMSAKEAARSSYFGIFDLCGIPKDRYYLYRSYWNPGETTVHILPHWNWSESDTTRRPVFVYSNGDCAELFLNGVSLGKRCKVPGSKVSTERFRLMWNNVVYHPGELKAVAYKDEKMIGEEVIRTAGEPVRLRLTPDRAVIRATPGELAYVLVEALDTEGNPCPLAAATVNIRVEGNAFLAAVCNGNPQSFDPFQSNQVRLFYGKAMVIVRPEGRILKNDITITAESEGLQPASVSIATN